ncbi:MAG: hypothetical protein WHU10_00370 [Fimbriimonadales bacterium]
MSLAAFALLVAAQTGPNLPKDVAIVYAGVPTCTGARGVRMQGLNVSATLNRETASFELLCWFKNSSATDVPATLAIPVVAQNPSLGRGYDIRFEATWDKAPVAIVPALSDQAFSDPDLLVGVRNKVPYGRRERTHGVKVVFKANATHALRLKWQSPIGKGGLDGMLRYVAFDTAGAAGWGPVGQFNFALRYSPSVVFQTYEAKPNWGWQIGPRGAFFKRVDFQPGDDGLVRFVYYPGGFDKIGE